MSSISRPFHLLMVFCYRSWFEILLFFIGYLTTMLLSVPIGILVILFVSVVIILRRVTTPALVILGKIPFDGENDVKCQSKLKPSPPTIINDSNLSLSVTSTDAIDEMKEMEATHKEDPIHHHNQHTHTSLKNSRFVDISQTPSAALLDSVVLLRVDVPLLYYNVSQTRQCIEALIGVEEGLLHQRKMNSAHSPTASTSPLEAVATESKDEYGSSDTLKAPSLRTSTEERQLPHSSTAPYMLPDMSAKTHSGIGLYSSEDDHALRPLSFSPVAFPSRRPLKPEIFKKGRSHGVWMKKSKKKSGDGDDLEKAAAETSKNAAEDDKVIEKRKESLDSLPKKNIVKYIVLDFHRCTEVVSI